MNYTIIGAGRSGLTAALAAKKAGHNVFLTESAPQNKFPGAVEKLKSSGIEFEFGSNSNRAFENVDCIVTSPGVPPSAWIIKSAEDKGIKIISELEFARLQCPNNPLIAITGTNGKTTTTSLIAHVIKQSGRDVVAVGNIGTALSGVLDLLREDTVIVAEVSSYQADRCEEFRPDVAMVLNLTADHLAYHGTIENYKSAKFKISQSQTKKDLLILNADDPASSQNIPPVESEIKYFSMNSNFADILTRDGALIIKNSESEGFEEIMPVSEIGIPGDHNVYNSMAAVLALRFIGISDNDIAAGLRTFGGVEHRLEFVRTVNDVDYINDSKATNIDATRYALSSYDKSLIWLAGGRGDSNDYSILNELVEKNVRLIVAIGEEADAIVEHFSPKTECVKQDTMENAVIKAAQLANKDEIVLFTPACKSFDMFPNYEVRGEVFKECVGRL